MMRILLRLHLKKNWLFRHYSNIKTGGQEEVEEGGGVMSAERVISHSNHCSPPPQEQCDLLLFYCR